jgi:hypothetical protein
VEEQVEDEGHAGEVAGTSHSLPPNAPITH